MRHRECQPRTRCTHFTDPFTPLHMTWTRRDTGARIRKQNHFREKLPPGHARTPELPLGHALTFRGPWRGLPANPSRLADGIDTACCHAVHACSGASHACGECDRYEAIG